MLTNPLKLRIGSSYDVHRLESGNGFKLSGIFVPCSYKTIAHSDGDVVFHAVSEAIFGALGIGDLGKYFPPNDPQFDNMDSKDIVVFALEQCKKAHYVINNIDATIILEKPKLKDLIEDMKRCLSQYLELDISQVSIKAGTNEGLDEIGQNHSVACFATVLLLHE